MGQGFTISCCEPIRASVFQSQSGYHQNGLHEWRILSSCFIHVVCLSKLLKKCKKVISIHFSRCSLLLFFSGSKLSQKGFIMWMKSMLRVDMWCQTLSLSFPVSKHKPQPQQQLGSDDNKLPPGELRISAYRWMLGWRWGLWNATREQQVSTAELTLLHKLAAVVFASWK